MTDYETRLISLNKETTYNADDWILLENDVMKDNSDLIKKIFGDNMEDGNTGNMLISLTEKISKMFSIKNDSLTSIEMNENNKYKYNYNLVYLFLKIFVFLLFIYVGVKLLRGNNISTEGITIEPRQLLQQQVMY